MAAKTGASMGESAASGSRIAHAHTVRRKLGRIRDEVRGVYWRMTEADHVTLRGVDLTLDAAWATPQLRQYIYTGKYEAPEYRVLVNTLRAGDRYLEVGAGIGFITTCACQRVGDHNVFASEANPQLIPIIERTAAINGYHPAVTNGVLGEAEGEVPFFVHDEFWASSLEEDPEARRIVVPARSIAKELERVRPTYLMLDIEGGEVDLLTQNTLPSHIRAICMETHADAIGRRATQTLLNKLATDGFCLDLELTGSGVAFLSR